MALMEHVRIHQPPPDALIAELVRAGLSPDTVMSMERWKAVEILELLRNDVTDAVQHHHSYLGDRGTI